MNTRKFPRSRYLSAAVSAALSLAAASTHAAPAGGTVAGGAANGTVTLGADTVVNQTASTISINWDSFDVGASESVTFNQPSATAVALNRILDSDPSSILGSITANGRIFLMNPNGIIFGADAVVNVGSLVATSLSDVSEAGGVYTFETPLAAGVQPGAVTNAGTLTAASGGAIALLGGSVLNTGDIVANLGTVALGVGRAATVSFDAGGLFNFQITSALDINATNEALVRNAGDLAAEGGQIVLTSQQAASIVEQAVNNSGVIRANRVATGPGGTIRLIGDGGAVGNSGTLDVSADDGAGGSVQIDGSAVTLGSGTGIDVGGSTTSGTLQVSSDSTIAAQGTLAVDGATTLTAGSTVAFGTTSAGTLDVTAGDAITQSGDLTVSGLASFTTLDDAGAAITLTHAANSFGSVQASVRNAGDTANAAAAISITENNDTVLAGNLRTAAGQTVTIQSAGNITQSGAVSAAGDVTLTSDSPTGSISLGLGNSFTGTISLNAASASLNNATATDLGTSTIGGALGVTSAGDITQSGALNVTGAATFNAAGQDITLGAANSFGGGVAVTADNASLTANATTGLLASSVDGDLSVTTTSGAITQSGVVNVTGAATLDSAAGVTLGSLSADTLSVIARNTISQTQGVTVNGQASFTTRNNTGAAIALTHAANSFGSVQASVRNAGDTANAAAGIAITESGNTQLAGNLRTAAGQNVTIISSGNISQSGALTAAGNVSLTAGAAGSITLDTTTNQLTGTISLDAASASLVNAATTNLGTSTIDNNLSVTSTGAIGQSGSIAAGGLASFTTLNNAGAAIALNNPANSFGSVQASVRNAGNSANANAGISISEVNDTVLAGNLRTAAGQTVTINSGGSITQSAAALTAAGNVNLIAGGPTRSITLNSANAVTGSIGFDAATVSFTSAGNTALGASTVTNGLAVESLTGSITQTGNLNVTGDASFTAGANQSITLGAANTFNDAVAFGSSGTLGSVTVADTTSLTLQAMTLGGNLTATGSTVTTSGAITVGNDLALTATAGGIAQGAALNVTGDSTFTAGAGQSVLLGEANIFNGTVGFAVSGGGTLGNVSIRDLTALSLPALNVGGSLTVNALSIASQALTVGGALDFTATAGGISQTGAFSVTGSSTFRAPLGQSIILDQANSFLGTVDFVGVGGNLDDVTVRDTTALDLSALTISGDLVATGATLSQSGGLNVGGTSTFTANQGSALLFDRPDNVLQGAVRFASNGPGTLQAVTLQNSVATTLGATTVSGDFSATATTGNIIQSGALTAGNLALSATSGGISQSAAMNVTGNSTFTAGTGQSVLLGQANTFGGSVAFVGDLTDVTIVDSNALTLQTLDISGDLNATAQSLTSQALTVGGDLNLTATAGDITQSAAMNVTGNSTFTAATGQSVLLGQANTFDGSVAFVGNLADVTIVDANALTLQTLNISGDLNATAQSLTAQLLTVGGNLALTATGGDITQTAAMNVTGNSTFTAAAGQSILLGQANTFTGSVGFAGAGGDLANVTVSDTSALTLQTLAVANDLNATATSIETQALTVGGNLSLTATTGDITQTAALNVTGNSTFTADAGRSILLGEANTFTGAVSFVGDGGNLDDITLRDSTAIELQTLAIDGDLHVTATSGAITQSGALDIGGTATFTAAAGQSISLVDTGNDFAGVVTFLGSGGDLANVSVRDTSALTLGALTLSGSLDVNADSIAQSGALVIGGDSTFTASGGQSIDLDNAGNTFTGTVGFAARSGRLQNVSVADTTALDLQSLDLGGNLTASAASLTQSGALSIDGTATLTSGSGIALNTMDAGTLVLTASGAVTQMGDLTIANTTTIDAAGQAVALTAANNTFGGAVALTAATAALTSSSATTLAASTLSSSLTVNSTGAISQSGAIDVTGGNTTLNSNAGVTLGAIDTGSLTVGAGGAVTQWGGTLNVAGSTIVNAAGQNVSLNAANTLAGGVAVTAANAAINNGAATTLGTSILGNSLTVNSAGAISQSGAISIAGTSTFNAAGQNVTLTNAGNALGGGITLTATDASLTNAVATNLQSSTLAGSLTVSSAGAITQSGALDVAGDTTLAAAGQTIALTNTANEFGGGIAVTGANVTLVDAGSIDLRASTVSGNLDVTALAGTITQSGALNVAGSSTFTAADGQSILLTDAANVFGGVRLASSGQLDDVALAAASGLDLQGLDIAGDLTVTTGGSLTQSGALLVAGDADFRTLNAGSSIALSGANRFGSVNATGAGDVSVSQGTGDLNLRRVTAAGAARLEAGSGSIVDDAADPAAASVNAASVELVALNNIGTVTNLLTRQGTAIAVDTNGGALAARVGSTNGQINLALPAGSAPTAAPGAIGAGGSGRLLIQSAGDLSLTAFNAAITGFSEIGFSADGTLSMPGAQSDLIAGPLTMFYLRGATDIARVDRIFNLSADHLVFESGSQGGDVRLYTTANRLDASVGAGASLTVQNAGDLTLGTISAGNNVSLGAANLRDDGDAGGITRITAANTITLDASAAIGEADGTGAGRIDTLSSAVVVNAGAGPVYLSHAGNLQVSGNAAAGAIDIVAPTGNITVASTLQANGPLSLAAGTDGTVTGNITLTGSAHSTGAATLTAANGGTIADAGDAATHLTAQTANLTAAAVGSQANALNVEVGTLNATVGNDVYVSATNALRLGAITAASASIGATGAIADDGDNATRVTAQSLTLSGSAVGAAGAGNEIDVTTDRLSATASAGGIYVGASGDVQLATLSAAGSGNDIVVTATGAIADDGDVATRISGGTLTLNATSIGAAGAEVGTQVTALNATASGGGVFLNEGDDLQLNTVSGTDVTITAGGALSDDGNDATRVGGTNVSLTAARIGTADNRVDTAAGSLSATSTAGGIFVAEQDDVALAEVRASGTGNAVDIRTGGNGSMTVDTLVTQGGAVNLTAGGTGSITVTGAIESNNGVVNLISGDALALPGLDTGTGSVVLRTVNDLNVGTITASSVSITSDTGNVSLGTIDATGGTVTVTANNGTITDGDSTSLTARDATLTARAIGGPDQALNLSVDNLTATASAGGIYINDIGSLALNAIDANGVISIVTTGALTQNSTVASRGGDIELFAGSISMMTGATTLSGNGNISYVANDGAVSLESLDAGSGRALVIAADSVYSTLNPNAGIDNLSGSMVEIRAGGLGGGAGEIGTLSHPINIATPGSSGRSVYLIVPAVNGIQTTTPSINYTGSPASLLLKGYTGTTGFLLFDMSSTFSPDTILSGDETIVPLLNGRVAVNSDSLSAAKQALSSGVVARINVDWAAFDPDVSLFGTLDPSLRLPADQIDEELPADGVAQ